MELVLLTDAVDLSSWTTSRVLEKTLKGTVPIKDINRRIRDDIATNNRLFLKGEREHYIVHGGRGYKWAENEEEISRSLLDLEHRAVTMLKHAHYARKILSERFQGSMENDLAKVRKEKGLTAVQLVELVRESHPEVRLDPSRLSKIENGLDQPTREHIIAFAEILGVTPMELFGAAAIDL